MMNPWLIALGIRSRRDKRATSRKQGLNQHKAAARINTLAAFIVHRGEPLMTSVFD
jgi:hypothetical protein